MSSPGFRRHFITVIARIIKMYCIIFFSDWLIFINIIDNTPPRYKHSPPPQSYILDTMLGTSAAGVWFLTPGYEYDLQFNSLRVGDTRRSYSELAYRILHSCFIGVQCLSIENVFFFLLASEHIFLPESCRFFSYIENEVPFLYSKVQPMRGPGTRCLR